MTVGSAGTVSTAGAAAPTAATARSDVADGWAAWPEPVPAKTGTASAAAATMASRRRISREGNGLFTLSFFRESCATAGRTSLNVPVVEATSRYVSLVWIGEGRRRRWAARARRRTAQRQISGCVREGRGRVSRSRHQGAAARRQTSQAGVTRARAAEMDNPGGCATPHAADGSARRQGRRAVCRTAKTRVEEGNRDICVSFGRRNASSADEGVAPRSIRTLRSGGTSVLANVRWHFIHAYSACQRNRSIADRANVCSSLQTG